MAYVKDEQRWACIAVRSMYRLHQLVGKELVLLDKGTNRMRAFSPFACYRNVQAHKKHLSKWQ